MMDMPAQPNANVAALAPPMSPRYDNIPHCFRRAEYLLGALAGNTKRVSDLLVGLSV